MSRAPFTAPDSVILGRGSSHDSRISFKPAGSDPSARRGDFFKRKRHRHRPGIVGCDLSGGHQDRARSHLHRKGAEPGSRVPARADRHGTTDQAGPGFLGDQVDLWHDRDPGRAGLAARHADRYRRAAHPRQGRRDRRENGADHGGDRRQAIGGHPLGAGRSRPLCR